MSSVRCEACLFTFNSSRLLREHLAVYRCDSIHDTCCSYKCCQRVFNFETFSQHLDIEHSSAEGRAATAPKARETSTSTATSAAKYQCETCSKRFIRRYDLTRHKRIHDGEMPYRCDMCQRSFALKCTLQRHVKTHEEGVGEAFECEVCKGLFLHRSSLRLHMRKHTGESPFPCKSSHCQREFWTNKHMLSHYKRCCNEGSSKVAHPATAAPAKEKITRVVAEMSGPAMVPLSTHHSSAFTRVDKRGTLSDTVAAGDASGGTPAARLVPTAAASTSHSSGQLSDDWRPLRIFVRVQLRTGSLLAGAVTTLAQVAVDVSNLEKLANDNVRIEVPIQQNVLPFGLTLSAESKRLLDRINSLELPLTSQPQSSSFVVYPTLQHVTPSPAAFNVSSPFCILISREDYARIRHNIPNMPFIIDYQCEYWQGKETGLHDHYRHIQAQSCLPIL